MRRKPHAYSALILRMAFVGFRYALPLCVNFRATIAIFYEMALSFILRDALTQLKQWDC